MCKRGRAFSFMAVLRLLFASGARTRRSADCPTLPENADRPSCPILSLLRAYPVSSRGTEKKSMAEPDRPLTSGRGRRILSGSLGFRSIIPHRPPLTLRGAKLNTGVPVSYRPVSHYTIISDSKTDTIYDEVHASSGVFTFAMREINGKPIRSRRGGVKHSAGNADRAADKPVSAQDQSSIAMASEGCTHRDGNSYSPAFYECSEGVPENVYPRQSALGHGPRESLTKRQHLQMFTQKVEFQQLADVKRTQEYVTRDKWRGHIIGRTSTTTTDPNFRIAWKSDRTLLRRGKPDDWGGDRGTYYSRITSHSKTRQDMREFKHNPENDVQLNGQVPPGTNEDLDDHMGENK